MSNLQYILTRKADYRILCLLTVLVLALCASPFLGSASAQNVARAINNLRLESNEPGVLRITWDAVSNSPEDYRVSWAPVSENFKTWTDLSGNAFPTSPSYTVTGLQQGARYKVIVRSRFGPGSSGPWSAEYEATIASAPPTAIPPTSVPSTSVPQTYVPPSPCPTHSYPADLCPIDLCPTDLCPTDLCPTDLCPTHSSPGDLCPADLCPAHSCPAVTHPTDSCSAVTCPTDSPSHRSPVPPRGNREVGGISAEVNSSGTAIITWAAAFDTPEDYRISWAAAEGNYKTWTDLSGNAFPSSASQTISGLTAGQRYKVRVRARYGPGSSGPWSAEYHFHSTERTASDTNVLANQGSNRAAAGNCSTNRC